MWAIVDPEAKQEFRLFRIYGTGHPIINTNHYIGTAQKDGFVWHVFEHVN
jgi:hypothetical protein